MFDGEMLDSEPDFPDRRSSLQRGVLSGAVGNWRKAIASRAPMLAALAIGIAASPAQAHGPGPVEVVAATDAVTREVTYADLRLTSAVDRRKLVRRVGVAVNGVCNGAVGADDESDYLWCSSGAWREAWPQIVRAERSAREIESTGASSIAATAVTIKAVR